MICFFCAFQKTILEDVLQTKGEKCFIGKGVANVYWSIVVFILFIVTFIYKYTPTYRPPTLLVKQKIKLAAMVLGLTQ